MTRSGGCPARPPLRQHALHFRCGELLTLHPNESQPAFRHMKLDQIIFLNQSNGATIQGLWRDMADTRAFHGPGEAPVGDESSGRVQGRISRDDSRGEIHFGHTIGTWPLVTDNYYVAWPNPALTQSVERALLKVKDARGSRVNMHFFRYRESLDDRAARGKIAAQNRDTAIGAKGVAAGADNFAPRHLHIVQITNTLGEKAAVFDLGQVLAQRFPSHGQTV